MSRLIFVDGKKDEDRAQHVTLRPLTLRDTAALVRLCNDMMVARYIAHMPHPFTQDHGQRFVEFAMANRGLVFGIDVAGQLVGALKMRDEFEYFLGVPFWGKGYATDAGRQAIDLLFTQTTRAQIASGYFHQNRASGRVLEKLGFLPTRQQTIVTRHLPMALHQGMILTRQIWAAQKT